MFWLLGCAAPVLLPATTDSVPWIGESPGWVSCTEDMGLKLNELLPANLNGVQDEDADRSDWLELAGEGSLAGWSLSTDGKERWPLPAQELPGIVLLWASGKDRPESLHTDFKLDAAGGSLFLHAPDGCVADRVDYGRIYADVSYGRTADGSWEYFLEPTPGAGNDTESRPDFAKTPTFSKPGGVYAPGLEVEIVGRRVHYSLDGSPPDEQDLRYEEPIELEAEVQPAVLRARAFEVGLLPSRVATATWSEDPSLLEAGVTLIFLTADPPDLFDEQRGIYVYGPDYEPNYPYFGANFWELWERGVHVELIDGDGQRLLDQDAGIQIAGGYSRAFDQRNFELIARSGYGPESFAGPLFKQEEILDFSRLYLRNGGDWCSTQLVDAGVQALFRDAEGRRDPQVDAQAYEPALVYINGEFWGLYELKERLDEGYIAGHHQEDPEDLDRIKLGWTHDANWELEQGDWQAFDALELLAAGDLSEPEAYKEFVSRVDVDNFILSNMAHGWIGNTDWWGNNIRMWRPHDEDGKFRWMVYDFGHGWPDWRYDHLSVTTTGSWKGLPIGAALRNPAFKERFIQLHADYLNSRMRGSSAAALVRGLADQLRPVMSRQRARWCGEESVEAWEAAVAYAEEYAQRRGAQIDTQLQATFGLQPVQVRLEADPAGSFRLELVTVEAPFQGSFYQGIPLSVTAIAPAGYRFDRWSGVDAGPTLDLSLEGDVSLRAIFVREP